MTESRIETSEKAAAAKGGESSALQSVAAEVPIEQVKPVVRDEGWWPQTKALAHYMARTEVHTYAFSVAANVILSLFPFIVMMLTIAQQVLHSQTMVDVLSDFMKSLLPTNQEFVMHNMRLLAHPHKGTQIIFRVHAAGDVDGRLSSARSGAEQRVGVKKNRNYLMNQIVSLGWRRRSESW